MTGTVLRDPATGRRADPAPDREAATCGNHLALIASETNSSPISPPPFMVGMAEIELDKETGQAELVDYVAVVDCGTPVNPNLARAADRGGDWCRASAWLSVRMCATATEGRC